MRIERQWAAGRSFLWIGLLSLGLFPAIGAEAQQLGPAQQKLAAQVATQEAEAEALTEYCSAHNTASARTYQAALEQWRERNRWDVLGPQFSTQGNFSQAKAAQAAELKQHGFKAVFVCATAPQLLHQPDHDTSVKQSAELAQLAKTMEAHGATGAAPTDQGETQLPAATDRPAATAPAPPATVPDASNAATAPSPNAGAPAAQAAGEPVHAAGVSFVLPAGWRLVQQTAEATMLRRDAKNGDRSLILVSNHAMQDDLESSFRSQVLAQFPGTGLTLKYIKKAKTPAGQPAVFVQDYGHLRGGGSAQIAAVGFAANGKAVTALLLCRSMIGEFIDRKRDFETMVQNWQIDGVASGAAWNPLSPPRGSGGLSGLFMTTQLQNQLNPLGGMDLKAQRYYMVLNKNGQFYADLPDDGHVLDMNFAALLKKRPKECGTYRVEGGRVFYTQLTDYGLVDESEGSYQRESGRASLKHDNQDLAEMRAVRDLRIAGQYTSTFYMSGNNATSSTGITSQTFIRFGQDGTYQKSGFASASFSNPGAAGTVGGHRGVESGRYRIDGYTLALTPATGGGPELYTIVIESVSASPKAVFINDNAFLR